jgi:hypothetical protein
MQRIHMRFQGNCATFGRLGVKRRRQEASAGERIRPCGNQAAAAPRLKADLLPYTTAPPANVVSEAAPRRYSSRVSRRIRTGADLGGR